MKSAFITLWLLLLLGCGQTPTADDIQYDTLRAGEGRPVADARRVFVHYETRRASDGVVVDSSWEQGQPRLFVVDHMIRGWVIALRQMREGDLWQITVPPELAYGYRGVPPRIGRNETLIFRIELLAVPD